MTESTRAAYCTMFDSGYLARGLALIESLRDVGESGDIWTLCLDAPSAAYMRARAIEGVRVVDLSELEQATHGLADARRSRSTAEYIFTCTPALVTHVLAAPERYDWAVYLDADMRFYGSPERAYAAMGGGSIGIVPHRFPDRLRRLSRYGTYNVAWVMFRNDEAGRACASWWRDRCIEWCYDRPEDGRYADQGYLDRFPELFPETVVLDDPGLNVAPWNLGRHMISIESGRLLADDRPLVFFHFHGLRRRGDWIYPSLGTYQTNLTPEIRDHLYAPYISMLTAAERGALKVNHGAPIPSAPVTASRNQRNLRSAAYRARRRFVQARERLAGNAFRIDKVIDEAAEGRRYG